MKERYFAKTEKKILLIKLMD